VRYGTTIAFFFFVWIVKRKIAAPQIKRPFQCTYNFLKAN